MYSPGSAAAIRANLDGSAISTYVLFMLVVPLKFWCRLQSGHKRLGLDDALTAIGAATTNTFFYITMIGVRKHVGQHADTLEVPVIIQFLKYTFAAQLLYVVALAWIKLAILAFYWKLFSIKARWPITICAGIVVAWVFGVFFSLVFTCNPVRAQWDITITDAVCLDRRATYLGASVVNVVTDVVLLALPLPYIWNLNSPIFQRLVLVGMFSLGIFVSVVSIIRLSILMNLDLASPDITYNMSQVFIWSLVETNVGLICACLPSLRPAVKLLGLSRLFPSSDTVARNAYIQQETPDASLHVTNNSQSSKRSPFGFMTTLGGSTKYEEEEDSFQMINTQNGAYGKNSTTVGAYHSRTSDETDGPPQQGKAAKSTIQPITVEREWRIESRTPEEGEIPTSYNAM